MKRLRQRLIGGMLGIVFGVITPACSHAGEWVSLFDGQTLSGWTQGGGAEPSKWTVEDGAITGSGGGVDALQPQG